MKISELSLHNIGLQSHRTIRLHERVTIIRGDNGTGKTTVLEACALLGHTALMSVTRHRDVGDSNGAECARIDFVLFIEKSELVFIRDAITSGIRGGLGYDFALEDQFLAEFDEWIGPDPESRRVSISMAFKGQEIVRDLKPYLKSESKLAEIVLSPCSAPIVDSKLAAKAVSDAIYGGFLVKYLCAHNRPKQSGAVNEDTGELDPNKCHPTSRIEALKSNLDSDGSEQPGIVSYFNTDMYDYGIGLDIRESPKHLSSEFVPIIDQRFHIFYHDEPASRHVPIKMDEVSNLFGYLLQYNKWGDSGHYAISIRLEDSEATSDNVVMVVRDTPENPDLQRDVLSSGENQALFFSLISRSLAPHHSTLIMDEADLHLSLPAAMRMYEYMIKDSELRGNQYIIVSHLPIIHPRDTLPNDNYSNEMSKTSIAKLIYIEKGVVAPLEDVEALKRASEEFETSVSHLYQQYFTPKAKIGFASIFWRFLKSMFRKAKKYMSEN